MLTRTAHRISLLAGLCILAIAVYSRSLPPTPVCGQLPENYEPIIAFEMARSTTDLHAIFGAGSSDCRTAIAERMDFINSVDCAIYIPIYGSFLVFFLLGLRSLDRRVASMAAVIVLVACAADYAENLCLFRLSAEPDTASTALTLLAWCTEVKWIGLGLAGAIAGYLLARRGGVWRLATILCSLGLLVSLASVAVPAVVGPYLSLSFLVSWLLFLTIDIRESIRRA